MLLTLNERFALLELVPPTGDWSTLKIVRTLREALAVPRDEVIALGGQLDSKDGQIKWADDLATATEIELTPQEISLVVINLQARDKAKTLDVDQHLTLCEKFLAEPDKK